MKKWLRRGSGEYIAFAIVGPFICFLLIIICYFIELSMSIEQINNALNVCGRSAAICTSLEDAKTQAKKVAKAAITADNIKHIDVDVKYAGDEVWAGGTLLLVTLSADVKLVDFMPNMALTKPLKSGKRTKTTVVCVENGGVNGINEVDELAAFIDAETEGMEQRRSIMKAIANVILNRKDSPLYPNSINSVITNAAPRFQSDINGKYAEKKRDGASDEAKECARAIVNGTRDNTLEGYMFYEVNSDEVQAQHSSGKLIGGMWFYRR